MGRPLARRTLRGAGCEGAPADRRGAPSLSPEPRIAARPSLASRLTAALSPFWLLQLAGWGAFAVVMTLSRVGRFPLDFMLLVKGELAVTGLLLTLGLRLVYRRMLAGGASLTRLVLASVVLSYVASVPWSLAGNAFMYAAARWHPRVEPSGGLVWSLDGVVYQSFILLAWSLLYLGARHHRALQAERERALRAEALAQRARLDALRYQLNPHFLFNALNAVSTLVIDQRGDEAARMLARLSDFLRATLDGAGDEVPLADELALVRGYLDIERVRFGDRLRTVVDADPATLGALVPVLLLQPLVENAVRHAVAPREEGGLVAVEARAAGDRLRLTVADDGPGLAAASPTSSSGIGLANTRERLAQLYGAAHRFALEAAPGGGVRVVIELPLRGAAPESGARLPAERDVPVPA
jgi:two-component system LytT family sensor kinase